MDEVVRARIDKVTKKELMILVKTKGKTLSEVIRTALEEYAKKIVNRDFDTTYLLYIKDFLQKY